MSPLHQDRGSEGEAMIHVIATAELVPGKRDAFLAELHANVPNVKAEAGCLEYGPTVDVRTEIAAQVPYRGDVVTIVEKWESLEALMDHLAAPHMAVYRENVADLVEGVTIQVLEPA
jgi:quinol monooxygenase YgiN